MSRRDPTEELACPIIADHSTLPGVNSRTSEERVIVVLVLAVLMCARRDVCISKNKSFIKQEVCLFCFLFGPQGLAPGNYMLHK